MAVLDGDGKLDLVAVNKTSNTASVFRNTAISGSISFATKVDYIDGSSPFSAVIGDFDKLLNKIQKSQEGEKREKGLLLIKLFSRFLLSPLPPLLS